MPEVVRGGMLLPWHRVDHRAMRSPYYIVTRCRTHFHPALCQIEPNGEVTCKNCLKRREIDHA